MRAFFAALLHLPRRTLGPAGLGGAAILLCLSLYTPALAQGGVGGPDSVYVPGRGYVERGGVAAVAASPTRPRFARPPSPASGGGIKKVAGHSFRQTPGAVSWHSSAAPWVAELQALRGKNARQIGLSRTTLWCGTVLGEATSLPKPKVNYHWAANWGSVGRRIGAPRVGAIALVSYGRRGRGTIDHVAVVSRFDERGRPVLISGNAGGIVREHAATGVIAYVWPDPGVRAGPSRPLGGADGA